MENRKSWPGTILVALLVTLASFSGGCPGPRPPKGAVLRYFPANDSDATLQATVVPQWTDASPSEKPTISIDRQQIDILLDLSIPMGGYMHTDLDTVSLLPDIFRNLSNLLKADYGVGGALIACKGVSNTTTQFDCLSVMRRAMFSGSKSHIDVAISDAIHRLNAGEIEAAALVSDLFVTADDVYGPVALLSLIRDPALLSGYNSGEIHLSLLGVRLNYWGVHARNCDATNSLGCWYHEGERRYKQLTARVKRPLYILTIGRSREDENNVREVVSALKAAILTMDANIEVRVDHLTQGSGGLPADIDWDDIDWANDNDRYSVLYYEDTDSYSCDGDVDIPLDGWFADNSWQPISSGLAVDQGQSSITWLTASVAESANRNRLAVGINCAAVRSVCEARQEPPQGVLSFRMIRETDDWHAWSSVQERPDRTLHLTEFISSLRPDHYEAAVSPFVKMNCGRW